MTPLPLTPAGNLLTHIAPTHPTRRGVSRFGAAQIWFSTVTHGQGRLGRRRGAWQVMRQANAQRQMMRLSIATASLRGNHS